MTRTIFTTEKGKDNMRELFKKILLPAAMLVDKIFFSAFYALARRRYRLRPVENLQGKKILVFSPHADDEILGCGGFLATLAGKEKGNKVKCLYLTDGSGSYHPVMSDEELIAARTGEGRRVGEFFGFLPPSFLGLADGTLSLSEENIARVHAEVVGFAPDLILLPYFLDGHRDHAAAAGLGLAAMKKAGFKPGFPLYLYQVNSPLTFYAANRYCPLSGALKLKKRALEIFKSQTMPFGGLLLLDTCRRHALPKREENIEAAEFYIAATLEEYSAVFDQYGMEIYRNFRQMSSLFFLIPYFFSGWRLKKKIGRLFNKNT